MSVENNNNPCKVWSRLHVTRKDGSEIKLRFQDISWDQYKNDIVDFNLKYFLKDETFTKAAEIYKSEEATAEYREFFSLYYEKNRPHITVCCLDDDSETIDILGLSLMCKSKDSQSEQDDIHSVKPKTKELQNFIQLLLSADIKVTGYESCYEGRGILVRPDQRGLGIANEFVRLRKQICIDDNIQMTSAWMTSLYTQRAADKYNWKTFAEVPVAEMEKNTGLIFDANVNTFKLMYTTKD